MKLKEFLKYYYGCPEDVTMKTAEVIGRTYKELCLPGSYGGSQGFRKTLAWNLDRDIFYRDASKYDSDDHLYVILTTGKMDFYMTLEDDNLFLGFLDKGLKKHRSYRKEYLNFDPSKKYLFFSRKYE